jgi:hypothetical protein
MSLENDQQTISLWSRVSAVHQRVLVAVGAPREIAALGELSRTLARGIRAWIALLESLVRKLLLVEAARLQRAHIAAAARGPRLTLIHGNLGLARHWRPGDPLDRDRPCCAPRACTPKALDLRAPETWSAPFNFALPHNPHRVPESRAPRVRNLWAPAPPPAPPPPLRRIERRRDLCLRLAMRLEALRRVIENPAPYAERLAELLRAVRRRDRDVVTRFLYAPARTNARDEHDPRLSVDVWVCALGQDAAFADSS